MKTTVCVLDQTTSTFHQNRRSSARLVDRMGGGDSFAAGPIHGFPTDAIRRLSYALP